LTRKIFAYKRVEITEGKRRLHNEEIPNRFSSQNNISVIRKEEGGGHVARKGKIRNANRILIEKPESKKPLATPMCR
jgi:hypothetical protein